MKKYLKKIERRLNLPGELRKRVMSDLTSSIQERREAGQTDEEIMAELGTPRKAAADLNEQMKEYTYQKSPWRFAFLAVAVLAGLKLLSEVLPGIVGYWILRSFQYAKPGAAAVGVIGGADGPTAIFVTAPAWTTAAVAAVLTAVGIVGYLLLKKRKQK